MTDIAAPNDRGRMVTAPAERKNSVHRFWILIFVLMTVIPLTFYIGPAFLNAHRALMVVMIVPLVFGWIAGRAPGGILVVDVLMVIHVLWMLLSLLTNHPPDRVIIYWFSQATETLGPYLLARLVIRDKASFLFFCRIFSLVVLFLLPFSVIESITDRTILMDLFAKVPGMNVPSNVGYGQRMGLTRVQAVFEHPILYGVYCAIPLSLIWIAVGKQQGASASRRFIRSAGILAAVFFSLSSGAFATVVVQIGFITWDRLLREVKARWKILAGLFAAAYLVVGALSNRAPLVVLISYVTFSTSTAYNRVLIWRYGTDDVMDNPLFGIGLGDWSRPVWMGPSVDNFWLLWAMRYGLVGFLLFAGAILLILVLLPRRDFSADPDLAACRKGYMFSMISLIVALSTVAFWGAAYAMFLFVIGSGVWMLVAESDGDAAATRPEEAKAGPPASRYSRFAPKHELPAATGRQSVSAGRRFRR